VFYDDHIETCVLTLVVKLQEEEFGWISVETIEFGRVCLLEKQDKRQVRFRVIS
jgi:hypothetical protein